MKFVNICELKIKDIHNENNEILEKKDNFHIFTGYTIKTKINLKNMKGKI